MYFKITCSVDRCKTEFRQYTSVAYCTSYTNAFSAAAVRPECWSFHFLAFYNLSPNYSQIKIELYVKVIWNINSNCMYKGTSVTGQPRTEGS